MDEESKEAEIRSLAEELEMSLESLAYFRAVVWTIGNDKTISAAIFNSTVFRDRLRHDGFVIRGSNGNESVEKIGIERHRHGR